VLCKLNGEQARQKRRLYSGRIFPSMSLCAEKREPQASQLFMSVDLAADFRGRTNGR
jgi:hypothetical protein